MFFRRTRNGLLIDRGTHLVSVARVSRLDDNPMVIEAAAEFLPGDRAGLENWLFETFTGQKGLIPAVCGFNPPQAILRRNGNLNPRRLNEDGYLAGLVNEHARRDSLADWLLAALNPKDGTQLENAGAPRHGLLLGVPLSEVRRAQEDFVKLGVLPRRLEFSTLPMLGGVAHCAGAQGVPDAIVVCGVEATHTNIFILGKDGVHTPEPLQHGFETIVDATQKEFGLATPDFGRIRMEALDDELLERSRRLVRPIARQLKPAVDYYELQTGQRVSSLFCPGLPAKLAWIGEALAASDKLALFQPDCTAWCERVGLRVPTDGSLSLGPRWLGPLSQLARLTPPATS
ncbi:MAG TPA: hypothetical protein VEB66_06555 [Opitutaceae bacterium]|nr:hypothetical protein [Opitutaceae bacterium]